MKNYKKIIVTGICVMALCFGSFTYHASAADITGGGITAKVVLSGTLPQKDETFVIEMTGEKEDTPMPDGSEDGVYKLNITGAGEKSFPGITYTDLGEYHYKIYQKPGSDQKCTYDTTVYHLIVTVMNSDTDSDGFAVSYGLYNEDQTEKQDALVFCNQYQLKQNTETTKVSPRTGDPAEAGKYIAGMLFFLLIVGIRQFRFSGIKNH